MPPPPEKARIEALIVSYEKAKESGADTAPLETLRLTLRMLAKTWGNYEYARKELAKAAVDIQEARQLGAVDRAEMQGRVNTEAARADKNARWITYTLIGGLVLSGLTFGIGALAF